MYVYVKFYICCFPIGQELFNKIIVPQMFTDFFFNRPTAI